MFAAGKNIPIPGMVKKSNFWKWFLAVVFVLTSPHTPLTVTKAEQNSEAVSAEKIKAFGQESARLPAVIDPEFISPGLTALDMGDHYATPSGTRKLFRAAELVSFKIAEQANRPDVLDDIFSAAGPLTGYKIRNRTDNVVIAQASSQKATATQNRPESVTETLNSLRQAPGLQWANPVFIDPPSGLQLVCGNEIILQLSTGTDSKAYFAKNAGRVRRLKGTTDQFILSLPSGAFENVFETVKQRLADTAVAWAEPDFLTEINSHLVPNDPFFNLAWHLHNTGQNGGIFDADVDAVEAWDTTTGQNDVIVAILDNGVETTHVDLSLNLALNVGETAGNGIDDDGNGYIDDVKGWDFYHDNNDPDPDAASDNHGTPVAGVAVGRGNNSTGVVGAAYTGGLLPVQTSSEGLTDFSILAESVYYAAGRTADGLGTWRGADIMNMSFGVPSSITFGQAITWAVNNGRDGLGCPIFVSSGNSASGYVQYGYDVSGLPAGNYAIEFEYYKDPAGSAGEDRIWVANVVLPDAAGTRQRFDNPALPPGWSTYGAAGFVFEDDPAHAYGTGRYAPASPSLLDGENSILRSPTFTLESSNICEVHCWVSSEKGTATTANISYPPDNDDGDIAFIWFNNVDTGEWYYAIIDAGVPGDRRNVSGMTVTAPVAYPASHVDTIAIGSSTNFDYRSHYSQYGSNLDLVAPSDGGTAAIPSTDRTGSVGYVSGDYLYFSGTSSASPLAAGVAALMLSKSYNLTAADVRSGLSSTAEKIGGVTYTSGFNEYYGYGRINAKDVLDAIVTYVAPDFDQDNDVDADDYNYFQGCASGPDVPFINPSCDEADLDGDGDIDQEDFAIFQNCFSGTDTPPDMNCAN